MGHGSTHKADARVEISDRSFFDPLGPSLSGVVCAPGIVVGPEGYIRKCLDEDYEGLLVSRLEESFQFTRTKTFICFLSASCTSPLPPIIYTPPFSTAPALPLSHIPPFSLSGAER